VGKNRSQILICKAFSGASVGKHHAKKGHYVKGSHHHHDKGYDKKDGEGGMHDHKESYGKKSSKKDSHNYHYDKGGKPKSGGGGGGGKKAHLTERADHVDR